MTEERRGAPRREAYLAGEIETTEGTASIAITRDVSTAGVLVYSRRTLAIGEHIKITLVHDRAMYAITGTVVRQEALDPEESPLWHTKVGVSIDDTEQVLAKIFAET